MDYQTSIQGLYVGFYFDLYLKKNQVVIVYVEICG